MYRIIYHLLWSAALVFTLGIDRPAEAKLFIHSESSSFYGIPVGGVGLQTLSLTNLDTRPASITALELSGPSKGDFALASDCATLQPMGACTVTLAFVPMTVVQGSATLSIQTSNGEPPVIYQLNASAMAGSVPEKQALRPYQSIETGSWPEAVAIGDVNGDGRNDVVMTTSYYFDDANDHKLFVFLQNANGQLDPPIKYGLNTSPARDLKSVAIGDLNGDGRTDVVVAAGSSIEVFLQNDHGTLQPSVGYATQNGLKVRIGDLNNDGRLDVASIGWGTGTVDIFFQNSNGTLNSPVTYNVTHAGYDDLELGDVDNDGLPDIVVMSGQMYATPNVGILRQQAGGIFAGPDYYSVGTNILTHGVAIGDVSGDGLNDVVVTHGGNSPYGKIGVFRQNATGQLDPVANYQSYDCPDAVEIADMDRDGRKEVIVLHGGWTEMGLYRQAQDGSLLAEERFPIPYASSYNPHGLALGDLNSDGMQDVAIADYNNGLVLLYARNPALDIRPDTAAIDFGYLHSGKSLSRTITISNGGTADATLGTIVIDATGTVPFSLTADHCSGTVLRSGQSCTVDIHFAPTTTGSFAATVRAAAFDVAIPVEGYASTPDFVINPIGGSNGFIECNYYRDPFTVLQSNDVACTATPQNGFHIVDLLVDGVSVGTLSNYKLTNIQASHSVEGVFASNFTVTAGNGGTIVPASGATGYYFIVPTAGYRIADVKVDGAPVGAVTKYRFPDLSGLHTIEASFMSFGLDSAYSYISQTSTNSIGVVEELTRDLVAEIPLPCPPGELALSGESATLYAACAYQGQLLTIDTATNLVTGSIPFNGSAAGVTVDPVTGLVYVTQPADDLVTVIDPLAKHGIASIPVGTEPGAISADRFGKFLYAANQWENTVSVIDTTSNSEQEILQVGSTPVAMALSPDGALLSVANRDSSSVTIISTATRNPVATVSLALSPERLAFSADGTRLYVVHPGNDSVSVIDVLAQKYLTSITVGKTPRAIAAIPGTREMYVTNGMSNTVSVIDTALNIVSATIRIGNGPSAIAVKPLKNAIFSVAPRVGDFGDVALTQPVTPVTRTFTVTNNSADELAITDIRLIGPDAAYFAVDYGSCLTSAPHIPGGGNCSVSVAFTPPGGAAGGYRAQLAVSSGSSSQPATVAHLKGQAVYAAAPDGDVTDDGAVSLPDALKVLRIAIDMAEPQANDWAHGDVAPLVNGKPKPDGSIGIDDAFTILRKATGLIVF